jgi:hypothetical protein
VHLRANKADFGGQLAFYQRTQLTTKVIGLDYICAC